MKILAIDPGTLQSAWIITQDSQIIDFGIDSNQDLLKRLLLSMQFHTPEHLYIEMFASYGKPVGKHVFESCVWIGRFVQAWLNVEHPNQKELRPWDYIYRKDVKLHLCQDSRAKDPNVRAAIIDIFGGSKEVAIGTKAKPGPLYGVKKDIWAALGVAITAYDTYHA